MKPALLYYIIDTDIDVIGLIDNIAIPTTIYYYYYYYIMHNDVNTNQRERERERYTEWAREGVNNIFDLGAPLTKKCV